MPESTCLHIQDRESGPIRVVELPWISVRIGRAAYCEVRLPDGDLAEEACRLTRRGRTWSLIPSSAGGAILFDGRRLEGPCPLPYDVPFRMGPYCLTLRNDVAAEPDWEIYPASAPHAALEPPPAIEPRVTPAPAAVGPVKPGPDPDRWRARWKAAEAQLKTRAARLDAGGQRPAYTPPTDAPPRDVERPSYRPPVSSAPPVATPPRPSPPPIAPRVEPSWSSARFEPTARVAPDLAPGRPHEVAATTEESSALASPSIEPLAEAVIVEDRRPVAEPEIVGEAPPPASEPPAAAAPAAEAAYVPGGEVDPLAVGETYADEALADAEIHPPCEADDIAPAIEVPIEPAREESAPRPARPIERGPRRRRPRERPAARRGDPSRRSRVEPDIPDRVEGPDESPEATEVELPSVRDILVNHRHSRGPRLAVERPRRGRDAIPTLPQEPGHWDLPGWLALPPVGAFMLGSGFLGCVLAFWWAADASSGSILTQKLMAADGSGRRRPLPPELAPPGGRWVKTTAQHLAHWALYCADAENDEEHPPSAAPGLVTRALEISPLNPTARLATSQLEAAGRDGAGRIRGLGLSRDSISLSWSARRLMDSGKKEAALRVYHRALSAAVDGGLSRSATPRFAEDPTVRRYFLPAEDGVRDIVAELASRPGLPFREWSRALPRHPTVLLATARLLRERGAPEADELLDDLLGEGWDGPGPGRDDPRLMAARAEALGLRSQWKEAADQYRLAIEKVDNDLIRRSWWFNLADVARRLNDEGQRQAAYRAVLASHSSDDIARRVSEIQRSAGGKARTRQGFGSYRAN